MGKIIVKDLKLFAYHGVNPEEKIDGQNFILDIVADVDLTTASNTDDLNDTVSYAKIIKTARLVFTQDKYDLIEKAGGAVADAYMVEIDKITAVSVTAKKPEAPSSADFAYAAVVIERER